MTVQTAIASGNSLRTRNLVVYLDIELVVTSLLKDSATKIVELSR